MKTKKPEITTVIKTQLYYDRYAYCVHWSQTGIRNIGHDLDRSQLHETFEAWDHEPEWQSNWHNRTRYLKKPQVRKDLETVQSYLAQQREQGVDFKLVFGWNCVYIYTNDVTVSDVFRHIKSGVRLRITQVQVQGSPDIISLVKPRHSFRTYFRRKEFSEQEQDVLLRWVQNQQDQVHMSPALRQWLEPTHQGKKVFGLALQWTGPRSRWSSTHFYIEHDNSVYLTMLQMIKPGIIRRTLPVVKKEVTQQAT